MCTSGVTKSITYAPQLSCVRSCATASSLVKAQASLAGAPSALLHGSQGVEERHGPPGVSCRHRVHGRATRVMSPSGLLHEGSHLQGVMRPLAQRNNLVA